MTISKDMYFSHCRNHHLMINAADRCDSCNGVLLSRAFYRFPCTHSLHSDCLWKEVTPYLGMEERKRAEELQQVCYNFSNSSYWFVE